LSSLAEAADHFAAQLAARCRLPIVRVDEFASSIEATDALRRSRSAGLRRRRVRHADIDAAAAAIILGRWLSAETKASKEGVA
jgi:RNase H-fold protein (predicted Holliday junction resolvase)